MSTKLLHGAERFRTSIVPKQKEFFRRLAQGQAPETLMIACSDSRVVPTLFTQAAPGDLFLVRNAGNIVPAWGVGGGEAASIEFAIDGLHVKHLVVCGHSHCGAVKAMLEPASVAAMPSLARWIEHSAVVPRLVAQTHPELSGELRWAAAVEENVLAQVEHLETHPAVRAAIATGALEMHAWVYDIETGAVDTYDRETGRFSELTTSRNRAAFLSPRG